MRKLVALMGALFLVTMFVSCGGEDTDPQEQTEANDLLTGLMTLGMMTNVDDWSSAYLMAPPNWEGPQEYPVPPEWADSTYYRFTFTKFPIDSSGVTIDSASLYLMFTPDIWDSIYADSTPTGYDIGILADTRNIWFHTEVSIPDTLHVEGVLRWNYDETWYEYAYDVSTIDESAEIDINTSNDINLSAQFRFAADGSGSGEDNYAQFASTIFVRYEFFAEPDVDGYDGYYTLLSEAWKVRHYFTLVTGA